MATNYKLKLDLNKLCGVQVIDVQGKKCVVLPVDDNGIFLSQRGAAYLDLNIRECRELNMDRRILQRYRLIKRLLHRCQTKQKMRSRM